MDRVNRRFFVASTVIAIPMVLLMASLSTGTSPGLDSGEVLHAVPQSIDTNDGQASPILQVAGNQPSHRYSRSSSRETRPGLLEVIAGSRSTGDRNHQHSNMEKKQSRGLLEGVFGGNSKSEKSESQRRSTHNGHVHKDQPDSGQTKKDVDWDGIPYHHPERSGTKTAAAPIQDPSRGQASTSTRIIRGGSSRATSARTALARTPSAPRSVDRALTPADLPKPPADIVANPRPVKPISDSESSRRSGRRDLTALEASIARKSSDSNSTANTKSDDDVVSLIPKVASEPAKSSAPKTVDKESEPEQVAANTTEAPKVDTETESKPIAESQKPKTALAAIGTPTVAPEPNSASKMVASTHPQANDAYTVPVDPGDVAPPATKVPSQPYAASAPPLPNFGGSTPAASVSHRSGPPASAFEPVTNGSATRFSNGPIGSGLASDGASQPAYQTARLLGSGYDPYGHDRQSPTNRMTTTGQPIESAAVPSDAQHPTAIDGPQNLARQQSNGSGVPMYSIPGHLAAPDTATAVLDPYATSNDNFDRSTYASRNQMRGSFASSVPGAMAVGSELPGIRVTTHGPSAIMIRQTSQFEIRVENRGSIDAEGVLIRAMVPDWADLGGQNASVGNVEVREQPNGQQLVWTIDQLPAGTAERMFVRLTAARSGNYDLDVDWTLLPQKSVTKVTVREPRLDLTIEGPEEVVYGQSQTYKVHVLNPGDGTAPNVVFTLSPNSATPQTQKIGDIPPGKEAQFDVELTAQDLGDLKIHGLATGELDLHAEAAKTIRVAAARLEAMLNGPELKFQNTDATYNLQVQNTGSVASDKIMATLHIPSGVDYIGGIDDAKVEGNTLRWEIISLPPGAIRNYAFTCKLSSTGNHMLAFDCKGTAAGSTEVALSTQVESIADLVLTVNDPPAPAPIGSEVAYEIIIHNRGSKEATDVRAVAQFSHGIEPKRIEGQSGEVVTGQVLFDPISRIGAGQEVRLRVIATADRAGHHRFRSEVRSGDTVLIAEEATHYMSPAGERVSRHSSDSTNR